MGSGSFAERLRRKLRFAVPEKGHPSEKEAAVLVPFLEADGQWVLIFTKRTEDLSRHKGEISFPGGMIDPDEDSLDAALRETYEELGVEGAAVEVVGAIPGVHTVVSGVFIEPWVGILRDRNFTPNQREIAEVIEIPYKALADSSAYREQRFIRRGAMYLSPAYDIGQHIIWGATARIVQNLLLALR